MRSRTVPTFSTQAPPDYWIQHALIGLSSLRFLTLNCEAPGAGAEASLIRSAADILHDVPKLEKLAVSMDFFNTQFIDGLLRRNSGIAMPDTLQVQGTLEYLSVYRQPIANEPLCETGCVQS